MRISDWSSDVCSSDLIPVLGLPACEEAGQSGCIIAWQSFAEPAEPGFIAKAYAASTGLTGEPRRDTKMLCIHPLPGIADSTAPPESNLGALRPSEDFVSLPIEPGKKIGSATRRVRVCQIM